MDAKIQNVLVGIAAGFILKLVWATMGLPARVTVPLLDKEVGIIYFVGAAMVAYGYFKKKSLLWIGLGMLVGIYLREITMTSPA